MYSIVVMDDVIEDINRLSLSMNFECHVTKYRYKRLYSYSEMEDVFRLNITTRKNKTHTNFCSVLVHVRIHSV